MTDYWLIPHNRRKYLELNQECKKILFGTSGYTSEDLSIINSSEISLFVDNFSMNQDPYIWNENFFYSFCHAHNYIHQYKKNDVLLFVSPDTRWKTVNRIYIDTIVTVDKKFDWPSKNERDKQSMFKLVQDNVYEAEIDERQWNILWNDHFCAPSKGNHNNTNLITIIGNSENSYLPLAANFLPPFFEKVRNGSDGTYEYLRTLLNKKDRNYKTWEINSNWNQYPVKLEISMKKIMGKKLEDECKYKIVGKNLKNLRNVNTQWKSSWKN